MSLRLGFIDLKQSGKDNLKGRAGINMIFYSKVLIFTLSSLGRLWDCIYRLEGEDAGGGGVLPGHIKTV